MTDDQIRALMEAATEGRWICFATDSQEGWNGWSLQAQPNVVMRGYSKRLADLHGPQDDPTYAANARLIAAAPDLAAECLARGAERDAALARVKELEGAILMVADQALVSEIPEGYGPEPSPEFDRGYDAAIQNARKALEAGNE